MAGFIPVAHNHVFSEYLAVSPPIWLIIWNAFRGLFRCSISDLGIYVWAPKMTRETLLGDLLAAVTVSIILIPQGMAYALLAGLDPIYGLYSSTFPLIIYSIFTTSSQVAVGPVAPTAILMQSIVAGVTTAAPRSAVFTQLHFSLALLSGVAQILLGFFRFGVISNILSWPVMSGFSSGAAFIIIISQFPDLLGIKVDRASGFFLRLYNVCAALPGTQWPTVVLGVLAFIVILYAKDLPGCGFCCCKGRKTLLPKRFPVPVVVLFASILLSWAIDFKGRNVGIAIVGPVPSSLPSPSIPIRDWATVASLAPQAVLLAFINYVQTVTLGIVFGKKVGEVVGPNKELFGLGIASTVGSFYSCHTCAGSFTRTAVQADAGARTPLTGLIVGIFMMIFIVSITRIMQYIPNCILAAIVLNAAKSLVSIQDARVLWRAKMLEFLQLAVTFLGVLALDIQYGLILGIAFSLATIVFRSFSPRFAELGRLPHTDVFVALDRYPDARRVPGVCILRLDGELHFGNVSSITERLGLILTGARQASLQRAAVATLLPPPGTGTGVGVPPAASLAQPTTKDASGSGSSIDKTSKTGENIAEARGGGSDVTIAVDGTAGGLCASASASSANSADADQNGGSSSSSNSIPHIISPAHYLQIEMMSDAERLLATGKALSNSAATTMGMIPSSTSVVPSSHSLKTSSLTSKMTHSSSPSTAVPASSASSTAVQQPSGGPRTRQVYALAVKYPRSSSGGGHVGGNLSSSSNDDLHQRQHAGSTSPHGHGASSGDDDDEGRGEGDSLQDVSLAVSRQLSRKLGRRERGSLGEGSSRPSFPLQKRQSTDNLISKTPATAAAAAAASSTGLSQSSKKKSAHKAAPEGGLELTPSSARESAIAATRGVSFASSDSFDDQQDGNSNGGEENDLEVATPPLLRAVILDASRVVSIDATAAKELHVVMNAFLTANFEPKPQLFISGLPGPVRDALDAFDDAERVDARADSGPPVPAAARGTANADASYANITRFLSVAATIASLYERETEEEEDWEAIARSVTETRSRKTHSSQAGEGADEALVDSNSPDKGAHIGHYEKDLRPSETGDATTSSNSVSNSSDPKND